MKHISRIGTILSFSFILLSCSDPGVKGYDQESQPVETSSVKEHIQIKLADLLYLLDNAGNNKLIEDKIHALDFHKKLEGVYISNDMVTIKKPRHWINITQLGDFLCVSFKTTDRGNWDTVISNLKTLSRPKKFSVETSDVANIYRWHKYKAETYEPIGDININLNHLYEVIVMPAK